MAKLQANFLFTKIHVDPREKCIYISVLGFVPGMRLLGNTIKQFNKCVFKQWIGVKNFSIIHKINFFMFIIRTSLLAVKREAAFCNVKFYQQLKYITRLIKFDAKCEALRYIASLRKVTMTTAIPVKRLPFLISLSLQLYELRLGYDALRYVKNSPFYTTNTFFYKTYVVLSLFWVQEIVWQRLLQNWIRNRDYNIDNMIGHAQCTGRQ